MARPNRRDVFDRNEVGIYHCVQRAVRRAYLCGNDLHTSKSYEYRREWILHRLQELAGIFAIDCLSFAILSNHLHVMLRNRPDIVAAWSDEEVAERWWRLFPARRDNEGLPVEPTAQDLKPLMVPSRLVEFRQRLGDISWWMRALAEPIARRANREDECTGRFWEGRFKCQKLADETAVLACSAYVDLNPVRSGIVKTPEESKFTSVRERIEAEQERRGIATRGRSNPPARKKADASSKAESKRAHDDDWLAPIQVDERSASYAGAMVNRTGRRASDRGFLAMSLESYLKLVDWTGRQIRRDDEQGRIPSEVEPILQRIGLCAGSWCDLVERFGRIFKRVAGARSSLVKEAEKRGKCWFQAGNMPIEMANS